MQSKLELKHISAYLPYGLKFELLDYKCDYVGEQYGICNGFYFIGDGAYYTFKSRDTAGKNSNNCKPILRPLSDLTKEIEHNGEKFVPIERLFEIEYKGTPHVEGMRGRYITETGRFVNSSHVGTAEYTCINIWDIGKNNHWKVQQLIKWHFALDIPEHLYININTIES